jgi:uncharacterized protein (TIGR00161 family)
MLEKIKSLGVLTYDEKMSLRVVELPGVKFENPIFIEGTPDVGLVGTIAAVHLIVSKRLEEVARFESDLFPPLIVIRNKQIKDPVSVFGNGKLFVINSDIPIPGSAVYSFAKEACSWLSAKKPEVVILIGGLPDPNRVDTEDPIVLGLPTDRKAENLMEEIGIEPLENGFLVGVKALLLKECKSSGLSALGLFAQSYYNYPDPGAAAKVLQHLSKLDLLKVDVESLLKKAEEVRINYRELMRRTESEMGRIGKSKEYEPPIPLV